jgi:uncharacterized protein (DUF302 family)
MEYSISKKSNKNFNDAVNSVTEELKKEGFGIITEIDLKDKFKEKLKIEFRNYKILGACNPGMAHKAILEEDKIGVMLPCNVLVQEKENGEVEIAAINPLNSIGIIENEQLKLIAEEITGKLKNAVRQA